LIRCHGSFWAGSYLSASVRGSINSCRLGRSERSAVPAINATVYCSGSAYSEPPFIQGAPIAATG
jgi:hypothetical protein